MLAGELARFTPSTITDPVELERKLIQIEAEGSHFTRDDLDEGAFSIAAPIFGPNNEVVAAISVAGPVTRLNADIQARILEGVLEIAGRISTNLGGQPVGSQVAVA